MAPPEEVDSDDDLSSFLQSLHNKYSHLLDQTSINTAPAAADTNKGQTSTEVNKAQVSSSTSDVAASPFKTKLRQVQDSLQQLRNSLALPQLSRAGAAATSQATPPSTATAQRSTQLPGTSTLPAPAGLPPPVAPGTTNLTAAFATSQRLHQAIPASFATTQSYADDISESSTSLVAPQSWGNDSSPGISPMRLPDAPNYPPGTLDHTLDKHQEPQTAPAAAVREPNASVRSSLTLPGEQDAFYDEDDKESITTSTHSSREGHDEDLGLDPSHQLLQPASPAQQQAEQLPASEAAALSGAGEAYTSSVFNAQPDEDLFAQQPASSNGPSSQSESEEPHTVAGPDQALQSLVHCQIVDSDAERVEPDHQLQLQPGDEPLNTSADLPASADLLSGCTHEEQEEYERADQCAAKLLPHADVDPVGLLLMQPVVHGVDAAEISYNSYKLHQAQHSVVGPQLDGQQQQQDVSYVLDEAAQERRQTWESSSSEELDPRSETLDTCLKTESSSDALPGHESEATTMQEHQRQWQGGQVPIQHGFLDSQQMLLLSGTVQGELGQDSRQHDAGYESDDSTDMRSMHRLTLTDLPEEHLIQQAQQLGYRTVSGSDGGKACIELKPHHHPPYSHGSSPAGSSLSRDQGVQGVQGRLSPQPTQRVLFSEPDSELAVTQSQAIASVASSRQSSPKAARCLGDQASSVHEVYAPIRTSPARSWQLDDVAGQDEPPASPTAAQGHLRHGLLQADPPQPPEPTTVPLPAQPVLLTDAGIASAQPSSPNAMVQGTSELPASPLSPLTRQRAPTWRRPPKASPARPGAHSSGSMQAVSVRATLLVPSLESSGAASVLTHDVAHAEWEQAHHALVEAGFAGLKLHEHATSGGVFPGGRQVLDALTEVLHHYTRRQQLVSDLLAATEVAAQNEAQLEQAVTEAKREVAAAKRAQEKAEQRAVSLQQQELPRTKAEHQAQLTKLTNQVTNLKQQVKDWEGKAAARDQEVKSLNVTIQSLQLASSQGADSDVASLKVRVTQLEVLLKSKEKELDKAKLQCVNHQSETAEDKAAALERAFAAEGTAQRLTTELMQLRTRLQQVELTSAARERELTTALSETDARLSSQLAALDLADSRVANAEEAARAASTEAAQAKSRISSLEASLRASQKEATRLKADMEALRGSMYDEVYQMEDEVRRLKEELGARASRVTQLEHVIKAKEREIARAKTDKDAGRAADRERVKVAEDVATRLETELQAMKQKSAQLESSLRVSQREAQSLEEALRAARGSEYDGLVKHNKAEEGVKRIESELSSSKMRTLQLEGQLKSKDREAQGLVRTNDGLKAELHEAAARIARLEEVVKHLEGAAATGRSKVLNLEAAVRVKEREVERLTRVLEAAKASETQQSLRISSLEDSLRRAEGDLAGSRVRVTQLESALKSKESTLDKLHVTQEALRVEQVEVEQRRVAAEEAVRLAGEEAAASKQRVVQLEAALKSKDKEVERIKKALDGNKTSEVETLLRIEKAEDDARQTAADAATARQRLAQVETALRSCEREVEKQQRAVTAARAAEHEAQVQKQQMEEAVQKLDSELSSTRQQVNSLEALVKGRDKEVEVLTRQLELAKGNEALANNLRSRLEEQLKGQVLDTSVTRNRVTQLEAQIRARDKALERSQRSMQDCNAAMCGQMASSDEVMQRLEAQLVGLKSRATQLESGLRAKDRKISALSRALASARSEGHMSEADRLRSHEAATQMSDALASLRSRVMQLEADLKLKDKESERVQKALDASKVLEAQMHARQQELEQALMKLDQDAGAARQRVARMVAADKARAVEAARRDAAQSALVAAEQEAQAKRSQAEETCRQVEADLQATKQRLVQTEASVKSRDRQLASLQRQLDLVKKEGYEATVQAAAAEEAARQLDDEVAAMRSHLRAVQQSQKSRDAELARLTRQLHATKESEAEIQDRAAEADECFRKLDADLAAMKHNLLVMQRAVAAKEGEVSRLTRALESSQAAEQACEVKCAEAEAASRAAKDDVVMHKQKVAQLESSIKSLEREVDKWQKQVQAARAAQSTAELQAEEVGVGLREAEQEMGLLRQKLVQSEASVRSKERDLDKLQRTLLAAKGIGFETEAQRLASEEAARQLDEQLTAIRTRVLQLESVLKARDKEVERSQKQLETAKAVEQQLVAQKLQLEEAGQQAQQEMAALRVRIGSLEASIKSKEKELASLQKQVDSHRTAEYDVTAAKLQTEDTARALDGDLSAARQRILQLEGQIKSRDREVQGLQKQLEARKTAEHDTTAAKLMTEEAARALDGEVSAARQHILQLENQIKSKDREVERSQKQLDSVKAAEFEVELQLSQRDETLRVRDQSLASLKSKVVQLETQLKSKDKEVTKANRLVDTAKASETHMCVAKGEAEAAASQLEAEAAGLRVKVLQLEGSLRLKANEVARAEAASEAALSRIDDLVDKVSKADAATQKAQEDAAIARGKAALLDSNIKVKEREIDRLVRLLESARSTEYELTAANLQAQEASRQLDEQLSGAKQRVVQLEGQVKARDKEVERLNKLIESSRSTELDLTSKHLQTEAVARQLDDDVGSLRSQLLTQEGLLRARTRDVERLTRQLEAAGGASASELKQLQETVHGLQAELANVRSKMLATETSLRGKESEVVRVKQLLDGMRVSEADLSHRASAAEEAQRRAEAGAEAAKQRVIQLEQQLSARSKEVSQLKERADRAVADALEAAADVSKVQEDLRRAQSDTHTAKQKVQQLEAKLKSRDDEVERLGRLIESVKAELSDTLARAAKLEEANQKLDGDAGSLRSRIAHVEATNRVKDKELERVTKMLSSAQILGTTASLEGDELARRAADQLTETTRRITQLEASLKTRDREVATISKALESTKAALLDAQDQLASQQSDQDQIESDLQACRQRLTQQESVIKSRDKEVERLSRQVEAARSDVTGAELAAGRGTARLVEDVKRLEAALAQAQARVTQLESQLASRDREVSHITRSDTLSKELQQESLAAVSVKAARAEDQLKRAEQDVAQYKAKAAQLERTLRNRELAMDKLRGVLADKVTKEERIVARDKQVYARLKSAFAAHRADQQGKKAAGAVSAAARELRPIEIVGVYEQQREQVESEASQLRAEVRLLSDQLRDAQNLISLKDRTGGWRNPAADAEIQAKVGALERRCAELSRELVVARDQAADGLRCAERKAAEAVHRAQALAEENNALLTELNVRPSLQEHRSLKREVEILERRIMDLRHGKSDARDGSHVLAAAGARAEGSEMMMGIQGASRSSLTSRERIRRDRELHRLGLKSVEDMPRDVLVDLVQDVCIELNNPDATLLVTSARKLVRVVEAVPRMEAFIAQVSDVVYVQGSHWLPDTIRAGPHDPTKVVGLLQGWLGRLEEHQAMQAGLTQLSGLLGQRVVVQAAGGPPPHLTPQDMLMSVQQLVAVEAQALAGSASLAAAEQLLIQASPQDVVVNCLKHFQQLFDCPRIEGVVPVINKVYMTLNELRNFVHSLTKQLGLPDNTSTAGCAAAVQQLLDTTAHLKQQQQQQQGLPAHQLPLPALQADAGQGTEQGNQIVLHLQQLFNASHPEQLIEAAERLTGRLKRLDEVLPRYQHVATQLYDLLRVQGLDDLVPAVRHLVTRVHI